MSRVSRVSNPAAATAAAAVKNVSSNGGHSDPSCSASVSQLFRPVTRSMTRMSAATMASPDLKGGGSCSIRRRKSISNASFSIQSAALRPTVTHARTPHKGTTSAWKPLTQPVPLNEGHNCTRLAVINPTIKPSRVASTRTAKVSTNRSASKDNSIVLNGKKNRDEETMNQHDQPGTSVIPSPAKKLQTCKFPSDACSKRVSSIRILGGKAPAPLPTGKSQTEIGKSSASVPSRVVSASANDIILSAHAAVPLVAQQQQPDTAKSSNVITESVSNGASQVQPMSAKVVNFPRVKLESDYENMPFNVPMTTNQVDGLAAGSATAPMALPKLQIGNVKPSNVFSKPAYARVLLIKQQEQLLQQYKLGSSQQQQDLYIKGPALPWIDETPPIEALGTRCQLCKLDVAFRPQGDGGRHASAPPVVVVLACHHAFHSSCIEAAYGLVEPSQCIACVEAGVAH